MGKGVSNKMEITSYILNSLEVLLRFSLGLTKNGPGAVKLMREGIREACQSWDELKPQESRLIWLKKILARLFLNDCSGVPPFLSLAGYDHNIEKSSIGKQPSSEAMPPTNAWLTRFASIESDDNIACFKAISDLPKVCRPAMILWYLEGRSKNKVTDQIGIQSQPDGSISNRAREYIRDELFTYMLSNDEPEPFIESEALSVRDGIMHAIAPDASAARLSELRKSFALHRLSKPAVAGRQ